ALGLVSFGGLATGIFVLGGLGMGIWSLGGMALGWQAFGGCAIAWESAVGGVAVARDFALGGLANAAQTNNDTAGNHIEACAFFRWSRLAMPYFAAMNLLWFVPMLAWWRIAGRRTKPVATVALAVLVAALMTMTSRHSSHPELLQAAARSSC
ncbi:MAG: polymerase sigma factor, partial [Verrucomicrobiaceae bacterium]|nr:polymerase sigma factor [Verrucomicrobiaceae bacterium]